MFSHSPACRLTRLPHSSVLLSAALSLAVRTVDSVAQSSQAPAEYWTPLPSHNSPSGFCKSHSLSHTTKTQ